MTEQTWRDVLSRPFDAEEVTFRVGSKRAGEFEVFTYLDARQVAARLSEVDEGWSLTFGEPAVTNLDYTAKRGRGQYEREVQQVRASVPATITLSAPDLISRQDTGETIGDISDENLVKTAYSDAFKRAAVQFGIGAYLYSLKGKIDPVSEDSVQYGRLTPTALTTLRAQYAQAVTGLYLSEDEVEALRLVLATTGKLEDGTEEWLRAQPATAYKQLSLRAASGLSGVNLLQAAFDAEKV